MATVGERNNNPGCIRGKSAKGYACYNTLEDGYLALNDLLYRKYNNKTCYEIFKVYAPDSDGNDSHAYSQFVLNQLQSKGINVDASTKLDLNNPYVLQELTKAISKMENGKILGGSETAERCSQMFCASKGLVSSAGLSFNQQYPLACQSLTLGNANSPYIQAMQAGMGATGNSGVVGSSLNMNDIQQQQQQQQQQNASQQQQEKPQEGNVVEMLLSIGLGLVMNNSASASATSSALSTLTTSALPVATGVGTSSVNFANLDAKNIGK